MENGGCISRAAESKPLLQLSPAAGGEWKGK